MAYNYEYPYTDPNRYNDDWLINKVKELAEEWSKTATDWKELESYVRNYFSDLDVQGEINNKLDQMAQDGTLVSVLYQYVPGFQNAVIYGIKNDASEDVSEKLQTLINNGNVFLPNGSYRVQGLIIPPNRYLIGESQYGVQLYGYGDDIIKFTTDSHDNCIANFRINGQDGFACVHCNYSPASGSPYDANNLIVNVRTSGGKYGFQVDNASRGVKIYNCRASGVSDTLFYIKGTDELLSGCSCQDAPRGYFLENNNILNACSAFQITGYGVYINGSYNTVSSCALQDCQSGVYVNGISNMIDIKLDRMGFYTPASGNDFFVNNSNNKINFVSTQGRKANGTNRYTENVLYFPNDNISGNVINGVVNIENSITVTNDNRAGNFAHTVANTIDINGKRIKASRTRSVTAGNALQYTDKTENVSLMFVTYNPSAQYIFSVDLNSPKITYSFAYQTASGVAFASYEIGNNRYIKTNTIEMRMIES